MVARHLICPPCFGLFLFLSWPFSGLVEMRCFRLTCKMHYVGMVIHQSPLQDSPLRILERCRWPIDRSVKLQLFLPSSAVFGRLHCTVIASVSCSCQGRVSSGAPLRQTCNIFSCGVLREMRKSKIEPAGIGSLVLGSVITRRGMCLM